MRKTILTSADVGETFSIAFQKKIFTEERKWIEICTKHRFLTTSSLKARVSCDTLFLSLVGILWLYRGKAKQTCDVCKFSC